MQLLLDKTKEPSPGFYIQKYGFSEDKDIIYIATNHRIYFYIPRYKRVEPSRVIYPNFINEWRSFQFSLYKITNPELLNELRESIKGIDRPGYNRLGIKLIKNPKKGKRISAKVRVKRAKTKYPIYKGIEFTSPGPYYAGGTIFYLDKNGKFKTSTRMPGPKKSEIMSKSEFNKKFIRKK